MHLLSPGLVGLEPGSTSEELRGQGHWGEICKFPHRILEPTLDVYARHRL